METQNKVSLFKVTDPGRGRADRTEHPGKFPKRNLHPKDFPEDVCAQGSSWGRGTWISHNVFQVVILSAFLSCKQLHAKIKSLK